ncbi:MAG: 2-phospho-L-lactate guanylyltransferase [Actinomycetes bacterium]
MQDRTDVAGFWSVVVPVKQLRTAKSRLVAPDVARIALAQAMALDTVEAALLCGRVGEVVVVTDEPEIAAEVRAIGAVAVPDEPAAGLNAALEHGAGVALTRRPGSGVTALAADLPALRPSELARALDAAAQVDRAMVPDASGAGTVLLTARNGVSLSPEFGDGSLARHQRDGVVVLDVDVPGLRRDVDTLADLRAALQLGCGPRTTAAAGSALAPAEPPSSS